MCLYVIYIYIIHISLNVPVCIQVYVPVHMPVYTCMCVVDKVGLCGQITGRVTAGKKERDHVKNMPEGLYRLPWKWPEKMCMDMERGLFIGGKECCSVTTACVEDLLVGGKEYSAI